MTIQNEHQYQVTVQQRDKFRAALRSIDDPATPPDHPWIRKAQRESLRSVLADLEAEIVGETYHVFPGSQLTVCVLTLRNGFTVTGESACASPENFDAEIGKKIAFENAKQKIWPLMGYALKQSIFESKE